MSELGTSALPRDEGIREAIVHDLAFQVVPDSVKRGPLSMTLLWLATQTTLSNMFIGFTAQQGGLSLKALILGCLLGTLLINAYGIFAGYLGTYTGQMQPFLTRAVFGKFGSVIVSLFLIIMGSGWYSFQAVYTGQLMSGILSISTISTTALAIIFTILMSTNNVIGFKGIGTFGRYVAPFVFLWCVYALIKGFVTTPRSELWATPHISPTITVLGVASLVVGTGVFGNEPDMWRFARGKFRRVAASTIVANTFGLFLFPIAGWIMGMLANTSNPTKQAQFVVHYSLFGLAALGAIIVLISQVALNDTNLYESVNAMTNVFNTKRYINIAILLAIGVLLSSWMARGSSETAFFIVAGIGASSVPTATSIMAADVFLFPRLFGIKRDLSRVRSWNEIRHTNWLAIGALLLGVITSVALSIPGNVIPNFGLSVGVAPVEGWIVAIVVYIGTVAIMQRSPSLYRMLGITAPQSVDVTPRLSDSVL